MSETWSNKKIILLISLILCIACGLSAQDRQTQTVVDPYELDLNQLSKLKITTATKSTQNINEIPSTIFVISEEQIRESGCFTLDEVLSLLPGFQFRNIQGINSYVFQRGIPNQNNLTLLLIDGIQANELNSGGFYAGGLYNLNNIERIEVVYGPSSVAYGTNAVSGIINIITKSATKRKVEAKLLAGSFHSREGYFGISHVNKKKDFAIQASGMVKTTDKADLKGTEGDYNWTEQMDNFENDYTADLKIKIKDVTIGTDYLLRKASTATLTKSVDTPFRDYGTSWNIQFINNYIKYKKNISDKLNFSAVVYNRNTTVLDNSIYFVTDTTQVGYYRPNNLTGIENILNFEGNRLFSITGGITFEFERLAETNTFSYSDSPAHKPPKPEKPVMEQNTLLSFFAEPRLNLSENLHLSAGLRFDQSSIYDQVFTPRTGLTYQLKNQLLRFSYSEAFRAPKSWDYSDGLGNPQLKPEKMKSFEAAYSISIAPNYKLDVVGYKNNLQDAILKEILPSGYRWINSGNIKTNGFEAYARYESHKFKTSLNYTFTDSKNGLGKPIPEISKHSANAYITYSFGTHLKLNLRANYIGERENLTQITTTNTRKIEPCLIFQGALSFLDYKGFSAQLIGKNLLNTEYYHTSNREPERYRQAQRTIMLSVGYSLNN